MRTVLLICTLGTIAARAQEPAASQPASAPESRIASFAPGLRINWTLRQVELDARVVLREGALELFACSPQSREHESIVAVAARPLHIYEALGLIGLAPGAPIRFDEASDSFWPPFGDPLSIAVRCDRDGKSITSDIAEWLWEPGRDRPMSPRFWVFAGSQRLPDRRFGADLDGTVICVVDFDSALISLPQSYSSQDEQLWLAANTRAIPPLGTACTLLIRAADVARVDVELAPGGLLKLDDRPASSADVVERFKRRAPGKHGAMLLLHVPAGVSRADTAAAARDLLKSGLPDTALQIMPVESRGAATRPVDKN